MIFLVRYFTMLLVTAPDDGKKSSTWYYSTINDKETIFLDANNEI
jgi:hypothetical protein